MPADPVLETAILNALVDRLLDLHPLPWKVAQDWLPEVVASDGAIIAMSIIEPKLANAIVAYAEARHAQRVEDAKTAFEESDKLQEEFESKVPHPA